jgi:hypothetical protein
MLFCRVGQNRICTPYMTVCMVNYLLKMPYIHHIYVCMYGFGQPYCFVVKCLLPCKPTSSTADQALQIDAEGLA